ncbi:MAG: stalk domain-containing protein, partial [Syntrophomonas sp.]
MFEKCKSNYMRVLLLLTVAIYISSLLGSTVDKATAQTGVVSGSVVNVRSGPSTGDGVIGSLYKDTQVNILAQAGEWYNIQFGQLSGWMHQSVLAAQSSPATGAPAAVPVQSQTPTVTLDGTNMTFDVPPIIENGRILVPMAAIFRSMGATVDWNQAAQTVTAVRGDTRVILPINSTAPTVNGAVWKLDVPARIVGNRTLAPLRFVGEALGGTVVWDAANFRAVMTSPPAAGGDTGQVEDNTAPVVAVTISSTVNLRGGPDTTYDVVAQANPGETLTVLGQQGNWYLVNRGERNAWVAGWIVNLIREGEAMPPGVKPPVVTPPVVNPSPDPGSQLDGLTISAQRTAEGLKIVMESGSKLKTEQSKGSGSISYEFADCQIIGTTNLQEYLGSSLVTVQGSSSNHNALVNVKFPTWMQYKTASENDGKREVLIIPNYVSEVTRKAFGSSGEIITIGSTGSLQYTSNISS